MDENTPGLNIDYLPQKDATCENMSEVMTSDSADKIAKIVAEKSDYNTKIIIDAFKNLENGYLTEDDKNVKEILKHVLSIYLSTIKNKGDDNFLKNTFFSDGKGTFDTGGKIIINNVLEYIEEKLNEKITHSLAEKNLRKFPLKEGFLIADTGIGQQVLLREENNNAVRISDSFKTIEEIQNGFFKLALIDPYIKLMAIKNNHGVVESKKYDEIINENYNKKHIIVRKEGNLIFLQFENGEFVEKTSFEGISFSKTNIDGIFISKLENGKFQILEEHYNENNNNGLNFTKLSDEEYNIIDDFNEKGIAKFTKDDNENLDESSGYMKIIDSKLYEAYQNTFLTLFKKPENLEYKEV